MRVFLSYGFRPEDQELAVQIEGLLESHDVQVVTGKSLGGGVLSQEVKLRIDEAHALVAVMTRRDQKADGSWTTHAWVDHEYQYAIASGKSAIALLEIGVPWAGATGDRQYIELDRAAPLSAILKLSSNIGEWKRSKGRTVKIQLLPEMVAQRLGGNNGQANCRHRLVKNGKPGTWADAEIFAEPGGAFIYVEGINDEHLIQIEARQGSKIYTSPLRPQWISVTLATGTRR